MNTSDDRVQMIWMYLHLDESIAWSSSKEKDELELWWIIRMKEFDKSMNMDWINRSDDWDDLIKMNLDQDWYIEW